MRTNLHGALHGEHRALKLGKRRQRRSGSHEVPKPSLDASQGWMSYARSQPPPLRLLETALCLFAQPQQPILIYGQAESHHDGKFGGCATEYAPSRLGDSAKMSDSRPGDSGFTRAGTRPQGRVPQDHLRSHCSCGSSLHAQPKQAS